jgi:branched-chain amino acid transport system permease protein
MCLPTIGVSNYWLTFIYYIVYVAALGQAWNLMSGLTGYVSFAHGAFFALGAYSSLLAMNAGFGLSGGLGLSAATAAVASLVVGVTSLRLQGVAFTFATLFFHALLALVVRQFNFTGGAAGLVLNQIVKPNVTYYAAVGVLLLLMFVFILLVRYNGVRIFATRDDETAAATYGIQTSNLKLYLFCISAAAAGLVGGIHGIFLASIYPDEIFSLNTSLTAVAVPLIGGIATATGPLIGALVLISLRELLQATAPAANVAITGVMIVLIVLFMPGGLVTLGQRIRAWVRS